MFTINNRMLAMASLLTAFVLPWNTAQAQSSGSTSVSINFPDIIILHYISSLTLNFTGDDLSGADEGSASDTAALGATASFDANLSATGGSTLPESVAVSVLNAWAVRGITTDGTIDVDISFDDDEATTAGGSLATGSALVVSEGGSSGASINVDAPGFSLADAVIGDVGFALDISTVTESSTHTGMVYTITASAP